MPRALPVVWILFSVGLVGCASLEQLSSGHVGCPPTEITISEEARTIAGHTWTAECNTERYYCSTHGGGEGTAPAVACAPASGNAAPPEPEAPAMAEDGAGCKYDEQCKLDRICEAGVCVDPPAPPPVPEPPPEPDSAPAPEPPAEPG